MEIKHTTENIDLNRYYIDSMLSLNVYFKYLFLVSISSEKWYKASNICTGSLCCILER